MTEEFNDTIPLSSDFKENDVAIGDVCLVLKSPSIRGINYVLIMSGFGRLCVLPYYALTFTKR